MSPGASSSDAGTRSDHPDDAAWAAKASGALAAHDALLTQRFDAGEDALRLAMARAVAVDNLVRQAWSRCIPAGAPLALFAVGGYGRGELFPHSDVDLLVLAESGVQAEYGEALSRLFALLWDARLPVGHAVRSVAECTQAAEDVTVMTALLEARPLVADAGRIAALADAISPAKVWPPREFFRAKREEQARRHARFGDTSDNLEPNLKEGPGGLRDLQTLRWMALRIFGVRGLEALVPLGQIGIDENATLEREGRLLVKLRFGLHLVAGRAEERLRFDYQKALAARLGHRGDADNLAVEQMMQQFYRSAALVQRINDRLLQRFEECLEGEGETVPLDGGFAERRGYLLARDPFWPGGDPARVFALFSAWARHADRLRGLHSATARALAESLPMLPAYTDAPPALREAFMALLRGPQPVRTLERMARLGVLARWIPAFARVTGRMQFDLFHVYTVDQHILMVVRNLRRFTLAEYAHEYPLCSRLMTTFERNWLLYIAALFHDIAKGRGGDHSQLGKADALQFCRAHGLSAEDTELVAFLVEHHLTMSNTAQKRDLTDPDVVREFAAIVGSERRLVALYLLTVADIRGTSPTVWNAWKGKLLEDLFHATRRVLSGPGEPLDLDVHARQSEALRLLRLQALPDEYAERLWRHLDVAYFLRHEPDDIAWQTRNLHWRVNTEKPVVKARVFPSGEGLQVMVYSRADRDLFARICGYFESINFNIAEARIHTTRHGYSLNSFVVLGMSTSHQYRDLVNLIEYELSEHLERKAPLGPPARGRVSRQLKHFPIAPDVQIRPDDKHQYHLLSVTAGDQPGLLYRIARVLSAHEITLHMAKIVTLGERAEDVFVVSGAALEDEKRVLQLEQELLEALA